MAITLTLNDGSTIKKLDLNGTNFVSSTEVDESLFTDENLKSVTISGSEDMDGTYENWAFVQQVYYDNFHGANGYYFCFREKTAEEIAAEENEELITELQEALIEIYELAIATTETEEVEE